jgi:hypothetical protein
MYDLQYTKTMWSSANITMATNVHLHSKSTSLLRLPMCGVHGRSSVRRSQSPTISNICFIKDSTRDVKHFQCDVSNSDASKSSNSKSSIKSCMKSESSSSKVTKNVSFSIIEIKEHPRILGDNPSTKKGPALSLGWYKPSKGRILKYSVDEFERRRGPERRKNFVLPSVVRKKLLKREAGVTSKEIFAACKEASIIRRSRREHNGFLEFDDTAVVLESCIRTFKRLLSGSISEWELRELMEQADKAQRQQQQ